MTGLCSERIFVSCAGPPPAAAHPAKSAANDHQPTPAPSVSTYDAFALPAEVTDLDSDMAVPMEPPDAAVWGGGPAAGAPVQDIALGVTGNGGSSGPLVPELAPADGLGPQGAPPIPGRARGDEDGLPMLDGDLLEQALHLSPAHLQVPYFSALHVLRTPFPEPLTPRLEDALRSHYVGVRCSCGGTVALRSCDLSVLSSPMSNVKSQNRPQTLYNVPFVTGYSGSLPTLVPSAQLPPKSCRCSITTCASCGPALTDTSFDQSTSELARTPESHLTAVR